MFYEIINSQTYLSLNYNNGAMPHHEAMAGDITLLRTLSDNSVKPTTSHVNTCVSTFFT